MDTYERARQMAVKGLEGAQYAHEQDNVLSIEEGLDEYEALLPEIDSPPNSLLTLTCEFWSGWADSATHDWRFYEPLGKEDWPRLCGILLENLRSDTEVIDEEIHKHFNVFPRKPILSRFLGWVRGKEI